MGIFDRFNNDPSKEWPEHREQPLTLSLPDQTLNGIRLGTPATDLEKLGRPSNPKPFKNGRFLYHRLGIEIELDGESVSFFGLPFRKRATDETGPCTVTVEFFDRTELEVTDRTTAEDLLTHLPPPKETDIDEDETIYSFEFDGCEMELEVSPEGDVCRLDLYMD